MATPDRSDGRPVGFGCSHDIGSCEVLPSTGSSRRRDTLRLVGAVCDAGIAGLTAQPAVIAARVRASLFEHVLLYFEGAFIW